ncbi:MAG: hypothetical protein ABUL44_02865 [Flavobacterium sp.]
MKIYVVRHAAACLAGFALFVSASVNAAGTSLSPVTSKEPVLRSFESFHVELKTLSNSSTIQLVIQKPAGRKVWITFKAPNGEVIDSFTTEKNDKGVSRNYNFTDAEEGSYSFEITDGKRTETKIVKLESITPKTIQQLVIK